MIELLYVSRVTLPPEAERTQMEHILEIARVRNLALGVTGALICNDGLFAQVLEGGAASVNQLMVAILRDSRHVDVRIVRIAEIAERRFAAWNMAEIAPDPDAAALMRALAEPDAARPSSGAAEPLIRYLAERAGSARVGRP